MLQQNTQQMVLAMKHKGRRIINQAIDEYRASRSDIDAFRLATPGKGYIARSARKQVDTSDEVRGGSPLEGIPLPEYVPSHWTTEWVATRLIWATENAGVGANHFRPRKLGYWPEFTPTFDDMAGWFEGDFRARPMEAWAKMQSRLSPEELRRHAEAEAWPMTYLYRDEHQDYAQHLMVWLRSKVSSKFKLGRTLGQLKISVQSHRTCRAKALGIIVDGLISDDVPVT